MISGAPRAIPEDMMTDFSFQLYSARNFPPLEPILENLAALGYVQVEAYAGLFDDAPRLAAMLKAHGLAMPTAHVGLDRLQDTAGTIELAQLLGIETVICPAIPRLQRNMDEAGWRALGTRLAGLGRAYIEAGLGLGWHNHDFEFRPTSGGKLPMDLILESAPDLIWEVDVAWLVKAGQSPAAWFDRYGARIRAIHVKDIAVPGQALKEDGWADVGYGTLDWQQLYSSIRARTQAKWFVMEHDNPSDVDRFARRSIAMARKWK
jgi:sugar phosphate isomerase/epimerase